MAGTSRFYYGILASDIVAVLPIPEGTYQHDIGGFRATLVTRSGERYDIPDHWEEAVDAIDCKLDLLGASSEEVDR